MPDDLIDSAAPPDRDDLDVLNVRAKVLYQAYKDASPEDEDEALAASELAEKAVDEEMPLELTPVAQHHIMRTC